MPAIIQETSGSSSTATLTLTFTNNLTYGNGIVVCVTSYLAWISGNIVSVTSGSGDTFQAATYDTHFGNAIFWTPAAYGGTNTVTITVTAGYGDTITDGIFGYAYEVPPLASLDKQATTQVTTGGLTSWASGTTAATTSANELWVGYAVTYNATTAGGTITGPGSGGWVNQTPLAANPVHIGSNYFNVISGYQFPGSTGTVTYSGTCSSQAQTSAQVAAFILATPPSGQTGFISASDSYTPVTATGPSATLSVTPPPAYATGDLLVMIAHGNASGTVYPSAPAGWTQVSAAASPLGVFTKTAAASETAYTVTFSTSCFSVATIAAYPPGTTVAKSSFSSSAASAVSFTPAFPAGVSTSQQVLLCAAAATSEVLVEGDTTDSGNFSLPGAPWVTRVFPFSMPNLANVSSGFYAPVVGLADITGSTTSPVITSAAASQFYAGYLVLNTGTSAPPASVPSAALSYSFGVTPHAATASTVTVAPPPAYNAGGLLVMCAFGGVPNASGTVYPSVPSGWTAVSAGSAPFGVFTKTATASEAACTVTFSAACVAVVTIVAYPAATVASSLFASSGNGVVTYTPAFPSGVTSGQVVLWCAGSIDWGAGGGYTSGLHTEELPAAWTTVIPPLGPSNDSVAGNYQATCIGLCQYTGVTGNPTVTSQEDSTFYSGFLVLTIPVAASTLAVTATAGGAVAGVAGTSGYQGVPAIGMALTVEALSGTQSAAAIKTGGATAASYSLGASASPSLAITAKQAGSRICGALMEWQPGVAYTAAANTVFHQNVYDSLNLASYGTFFSLAPPSQGVATTYGATSPANTRVNVALAEILAASSGSIATAMTAVNALGQKTSDFPAPAVQQTAIFPSQPPTGALLVATVSCNSHFVQGGTITMSLADSSGLTWTPLAESNTASGAYAGVWVAQVPGGVVTGGASTALDITTLEMPTAQVGQAWAVTLVAAGGTGGGYTWAVSSGALPAWAALSSAGVLSGTPTGAAATVNFAVTVTDSGGNTSVQSYTLVVITGPSAGPSGSWTLAFADEFNVPYVTPYGTGPNPNRWSDRYEPGDMARVNNTSETEWYPHGYYGHSVANSVWTGTAVNQNPQSVDPTCPNPLQAGGPAGSFTAGNIQGFLGGNTAFTYGYTEARIQQPAPSNAWCAFWMVTRGNIWPPEIDIAEWQPPGYSGTNQIGYDNTAGTWQSYYQAGDSNTWDVWGCQITASQVTYWKNGSLVTSHTYDGNALPWYPMCGLATDSASGSGYPASYLVDYIRTWVPAGVPAAPVITSISPASGIPTAGSVAVSFGTVTGATSYRVTAAPTDSLADGYTAGGTESGGSFTATGTSSPLTVTGLPNGIRWNFTVCAINATGYSMESAPAGPQVINIQAVTAVLPPAQAGVPYSTTLAATAGHPPYTWSISAGLLPAWATLNTSTGVISGTPATAGSTSFTAKVTGASGWTGATTTANTAAVPLTLTVTGASAGPPSVTTTTLPGATSGTAYLAQLAESGGTAPFTWSISAGALPSWAVLNVTTGVISGTPAAAGTGRAGVYRGPCGAVAQNGVTSGGAQSGIAAYQAWLGTTVQYVLDYMTAAPSSWAQFTGCSLYKPLTGFTTLNTWGTLAGGRTMVLGVSACAGKTAGSGGATWAAEAAGTNDSYWTALGTNLVSWGYGNAILRIGREFNYAGYNWSPSTTGDTAAQYIAGYQHIVTLLRAIPGSSFSMMWNPALSPGTVSGQTGTAAETQNWYPGSAYVDSIGLDVYDWGNYPTQAAAPYGSRTLAQQQSNWTNILSQQDGITSWQSFAAANGKQLAFPEWGLQLWLSGANYYGGGDDAYYIGQMSALMAGAVMEAPWEDPGNGLFDTDAYALRAAGMQAPDASRTAFLGDFGNQGSGTGTGTASFTVKVTDATGLSATQALSITTAATSAGQPVITTTSLPGAVTGTPYSATLTAAGGTRSGYAWSISNGLLPSWASLSPATGVISGTPPAGSIVTEPSITTTSLPGGTAGTAYTAALAATEVSVTIPPATGTASFTVALTDSGYNTVTQPLSITTVAAGSAGLAFTPVPGTLSNAAGDCYTDMWAAVAQTAGSGTISASGAGGSAYGLAAWVWRGSGGIGAATSSGTAAGGTTLPLNRTGPNSAVAGGIFDYGHDAVTGYSWTPAATDARDAAQDGAIWSYYVADWNSQGAAGLTSYGLTGTSGGPFAGAFTEILGTTTASTSPTARITITPSCTGEASRPGAGGVISSITITPSCTSSGGPGGWQTITWNADDVLDPGTLTNITIADGTIVASNIAGGAITGDKIAANTITANNLAAGAVTANSIAASTITAQQIAAGTILAQNLAANIVQAGIVNGTVIEGATIIAAGASGEILVYSSQTPAQGNLITSISGAAGTDSYGNAYPAGLSVNAGLSMTGANVILYGSTGEILVYSGTPASGNMVHSISAAGGTDAFGNVYYPGSCSYSGSIVAQLHGAAVSVGTAAAIAAETTGAQPGGLSNVQGTLGRVALWSGQTTANEGQGYIEVLSAGAGAGTANPGTPEGQININAATVTVPSNTSFQTGNVTMTPPMAVPTGYPLATDPFSGTIFGSGERANYINTTITCLNSLIAELTNRHFFG